VTETVLVRWQVRRDQSSPTRAWASLPRRGISQVGPSLVAPMSPVMGETPEAASCGWALGAARAGSLTIRLPTGWSEEALWDACRC